METVYRDFSPKGVKFYYVYKQLAHPEMNSYVDPVNLEERLKHVSAAKKSLKTEFTWICDNMSNDLKHALGDRPNSEFVIDPEGKIVIKRSWSSPQQLREDLEGFVGKPEETTTVADLGYEINPQPQQVARNVVERIQLPGQMAALKSVLESNSEGDNNYVKLRAEADADLMESGSGQLYLAFHVDPIYRVHWNNESAQVEYELELPEGLSTDAAKGQFKKVEVKADADPREFLIKIDGESVTEQPIKITARFMICDDDETFCVPVTQEFSVFLERDRDQGRRMGVGRGGGRGGARGGGRGGGRGGARGGGRGGARGGGRGGGGGNFADRMKQMDADGDGKLSREEMPERMQERFDQMDSNSDGFLDEEEMQALGQRGGGRGGQRGRGYGKGRGKKRGDDG